MKVIVDLDRVIADTNSLKDDAIKACVEAGLCTEDEYRREYAAWSTEARNTQNVADMSPEEQKKTVSWVAGFVPRLAKVIGADEAKLASLDAIHRDALSRVKAYEGVMKLLRRIPKKDLYIVTAGGDIDQNMKLTALGIRDFVLSDHVAIVPAKDKETFEIIFDYWKFTESEQIVHINDRAEEFNEQLRVHERTICIQPLWGWAEEDRYVVKDAPLHYAVESVEECATVLEAQMGLTEGTLHSTGEIPGKSGV